ncbi:helix-turn-helix domain-containing protein [Micromonospora echinofusca]|uniref:Helix-turn-helix domain-containing protein n=1 Tax=Micromonospora echinofusca TaxID=47858 RepID=A0ABS3VXK1_MICEH|nr:helix-turn-helix domain-containing protein [Micromonospora echinofusca]MBO4209275.1 helix-turn-helix domain-containing protein [Micromonospora echinofusca]
MARAVKRPFRYRFYPTAGQAAELARTFGCVRLVYNMALQARKLCSVCGALAQRMPLTVRTWTCRCGTAHDRDVNAARTILAEGLSVIACGGGVRPQRESSRTARSSAKQENPRATTGTPVR